MKQLILFSALVALFFSCASTQTGSGSKITSTLKVYGQCGMCKEKIETELSYTPGVSFGEWNTETKELTVRYNPKKITLDKIKQVLADIGYDSETHRASDEAYNKLHHCCKYERPE